MRRESQPDELKDLQEIEREITEGLALLGRWSHLYEQLRPAEKQDWKAVVARAQGSGDRAAVRGELDGFINTTLKPLVERLD